MADRDRGRDPSPTDEPWIWYLVNICTLAAVLAFPLPLQIVWTALAPLLFGLVRLIQGGFAPDVLVRASASTCRSPSSSAV